MPLPKDPTRPNLATQPDQLDPHAFVRIDFLEGERILRCWRLPHGFLLLTNLRCFRVWEKRVLFEDPSWQTGPEFFFYDLQPPRILDQRFVELVAAEGGAGVTARFLVQDPETARSEIEAARLAGRTMWDARRRLAEHTLKRPMVPAAPPGTTVIREVIHEVVKVPCSYCGTLVDVTDPRCPSCGAPLR
jgi:hypothetical protein